MSTLALGLVLVSALLHAVWSTAIKGSRDPLAFNLMQALLTVAVGFGVFAFAFEQGQLAALPPGLWPFLLGTSVSHGVYYFFMSRALTEGDLTLVYPIARSTPAFLPLIAVPLLGESISFLGGVGIFTVVAGMWLVHSQGQLHWRALLGPGAGFAYLTLLSTVAYSLFDKAAMGTLEGVPPGVPTAVLFYFLLSAGSTIFFLPLALWQLTRERALETARREWRGAAAAAAVSFVGYGLILEAYRSAPASYVVAVRQASVLFALALGMFFLGERPGRMRVLGAAATVLGVILIALYS
jgi:drug/metabolite transporter (DMT)-like permease